MGMTDNLLSTSQWLITAVLFVVILLKAVRSVDWSALRKDNALQHSFFGAAVILGFVWQLRARDFSGTGNSHLWHYGAYPDGGVGSCGAGRLVCSGDYCNHWSGAIVDVCRQRPDYGDGSSPGKPWHHALGAAVQFS